MSSPTIWSFPRRSLDAHNVAFVQDWLAGGFVGSEKVLAEMLAVLPQRPIYTLVHKPEDFVGTPLQDAQVHTSVLQSLPGAVKHYRHFLPLMPYAVEQFDLSGYDVVVSSSHAVAKGVLVGAEQLHLSYVHSPIRYVWDLYQQYLREANLTVGVRSVLARIILHYIRIWDGGTANRVDVFLANSAYVARRIWRTYRRPARVLYPPVDTHRFDATQSREDFYLTMSRFVPYKKIDLIVETFTRLGKPLVVIGSGPDFAKVQALAGPTVQLLGRQPDEVVADYMARCRAFVFAADEDFGIVPVEAQAAGAPVIAYGKGGSLETVIPDHTGILFGQQNVPSLTRAVELFETRESEFSAQVIRQNAERFSAERFRQEFRLIYEAAVLARNEGRDPEQAVMQLP
ncbi:glycosyl transferase, group 1 [Deinococcus geothermalis DSM 11300]|uniref:Glycosyl transferase, group 1 n=1 Tax=Deinococcus geothermalis (strain DSM 11300 / CIP 105573 / AG-3a) TaxID=319795 RepID=Q1J1I2_DEIGD|nr:glycosyltransferase [Deinococcus geothermalis]ABF44652.1 glycosyl transferase, group 1 [Deinococcus geothermalis DSM 11300]